MITNCIISESIFQNQRKIQQITNLVLSGFITLEGLQNSDSGRLYASFTKESGVYTLILYKDASKLDSVASATHSGALPAMVSVSEENGSGISGQVNFFQYVQDDASIEVIAFLATDSDLPLANLETLAQFDPQFGFINYHIEAFNYCKALVIAKYKTLLFNKEWVDSKQLNNATGGYDLSKILNWESLKEVSAHYSFIRLCEKQWIEPGSAWEARYKESKNVLPAKVHSIDMRIDTNGDRVEEKSRTMATWKIGRA